MPSRDRLIDWLWLAVLGAVTSAACVVAAREVGVTFDEPLYLEQGLRFWHTGSHRQLMKAGTMPLPIDVQTLPIAVVEWCRGEPFQLKQDFAFLIVWMRHGNLVFWWMLLYFGMKLGRILSGPWAGRVAAAALACEPNLLAHAALGTTDIAVTAMLLGFICAFHEGRDGAWKQRVLGPGIWCGVCLLSKASALAFCPLLMLSFEGVRRINQPSRLPWRQQAAKFLRDTTAIVLIGLALACVGCGSDFLPNDWFVGWSAELHDGPLKVVSVWIANHVRLFGNAGEALVNQIQHNARGHGQFLLGSADQKPFWFYFPVLFAIKLTLPVLAATLAILVVRPRAFLQNAALAAFALLLVFSINCRVQIGIRLQFPAVAMLLVGLSSAATACWGASTWRRCVHAAVVVAGIIAMASASVMAFPHGLNYVNQAWGGSGRAWQLVGDSNCDWGQGLAELAQWHVQNGRPGLDVWYFGKDPRLKSMPVRDLPLHCLPLTRSEDLRQYIWGRKLAVSASVLHGHHLTPAYEVAMSFLRTRRPVARTRTFFIYDFSDIQPPVLASGPVE